jgi:hypothetical protein
MSRNRLRRPLAWCLTATILLPAVLALLLGLGRLLAALGDEAGATACDRVALLTGVLWAVAIVGGTICSAAILLQARPRAAGRRRRRRAAQRRWRRARREWHRRRQRGRRRAERLWQERRHRGHRERERRRRERRQERAEGEGRSDPGDVR